MRVTHAINLVIETRTLILAVLEPLKTEPHHIQYNNYCNNDTDYNINKKIIVIITIK